MAVCLSACGSPEALVPVEPYWLDDQDKDGVPDSEDCDPQDPALGAVANDADCDGLSIDEDCDDADPSSTARADDADCDGLTTSDDCDDTDPAAPSRRDDGDCDGVPAFDDCDDADPSSTVRSADGDCDGILTDEDCNDADATMPADDADCDGLRSWEDCDDTDATIPASDQDCDGVPTEADCDDADATMPADDADCDGVPTASDCDDNDASLRFRSEDTDCDGVLAVMDCDDDDPSTGSIGAEATAITMDGVDLVRICAHAFDMGCTPAQSDCNDDEQPVMPVTLTHDFYIGEAEVTQREYTTLMGANPSYLADCGDTCPVEYVSWPMAAAYTNALSAASGLEQCYTCTGSGPTMECTAARSPYECEGYRLATEAEWEAAARCGEDLLYAGSNTASDVGWYNLNSGPSAQPVKGLAPNACGIYDMSGNVWEWTQDGFDSNYYTASGRTDPEGGTSDFYRSRRGGCWYDSTLSLRLAARYKDGFAYQGVNLGLRVARTAN